jgi:uncharacterized membrane-anchored protein YjiN (DUF445 family)
VVEQLSAADTAKRRGLRRMKVIALGALVVAAIVYGLAQWGISAGWGWLGYVRAAAEASMVGALADWFAVTALFRRPLALPIPHTAIIPTRKNAIGENLGAFIGTNFLAEDVVSDKLRRAELPVRIGDWLAQGENAERITAELAGLARGAVAVLRDEDVQAVLDSAIVRKLLDKRWGPPLGAVLERVFADGSHHRLVDLVAERGYAWVRDNHATVLRVVSERAPSWSPRFFDEMLADKVYTEVLAFAWAVKGDEDHPMRQALDTFLVEFADDLQHDEHTIARAEAIKRQVVEHPEVAKWLSQAWGTAKAMLLDAAGDPSSELRIRVRDGLVALGGRLGGKTATRQKLDRWIEQAASYVVDNYRGEITTLITDTVERWDAGETSRKIELQVGKDLQFIRLNGTMVGALVGLVIYALTRVFVM